MGKSIVFILMILIFISAKDASSNSKEINQTSNKEKEMLTGIKSDQSSNAGKSFFSKFLNSKKNHKLKWQKGKKINVVVYDNYSSQFKWLKNGRLITETLEGHVAKLRSLSGFDFDVKIIQTTRITDIKKINPTQQDPSIKIEFSSSGEIKTGYEALSEYIKVTDVKGYSVGSLYENFVYYDASLGEIKKATSFIYPSVILGVVPYLKLTEEDLNKNIYEALLFLLGFRSGEGFKES